MKELKAGIIGNDEVVVTEANTAAAMGSGTLPVFATPALVALMEKTAQESVQDALEEGCGSVGTMICAKHVSATPVGMKVTCQSELVADRRPGSWCSRSQPAMPAVLWEKLTMSALSSRMRNS